MTRADNDSWDLATSVGATATLVAAARAVASRTENPLIDDPFAEPLVRAVGIEFFARWAAGELQAADVDGADDTWGLQRLVDILSARTRYFDAFLADAMAAGIRQVVILASGLDARGYRLSWPAGATVFEIDLPQVLEFKLATLRELGAEPTAEVRLVPIDLRLDWPSALREAGFDAGQPTAWLAEGLLPFLPPDAQDCLLDDVTGLSAPGSRLASEISIIKADPNALSEQPPDTRNAASNRWREHGFDLDMAALRYDEGERNDVAAYLDDRGWRSERVSQNKLLSDNGLPAVSPTAGAATQVDNHYCTSVREQ